MIKISNNKSLLNFQGSIHLQEMQNILILKFRTELYVQV